jgi:Protein kinase domain
MAASIPVNIDALLASDTELRTLILAILAGGAKGESFLDDVFSICQRKPQAAQALRELIDRHQRLGRIPLSQHEKINAKIEQAVGRRALPVRTPPPPAPPAAFEEAPPRPQRTMPQRVDNAAYEDLTCELLAEPSVDLNPTLETPPFAASRAAPLARVIAPRAEPVAAREPLAIPEAAASEPAGALGQVLKDRYELQILLGRGGMASVYKAIDRDRARLGLTDQSVAVKVVQGKVSRPGSPAALVQEFQSAQRLSHPNVINVFDIDLDGDTIFYSMELLSGARLSQVLRRVDGTVLQRRYALAIIREIGAAVAHAHSRGVVHADLKPSNVMITNQGEVRVLDFGGPSMPPREPWVSEGDADDAYHHATPAYASCEQLERRRADPRDDIYALACIGYLLLAGRHPYDYLSSIEARARGMPPRRPAGMPWGQWRALRQGLAWPRADQPPSIEPWLARLGLKGAAARLPPLQDLTAAAVSHPPWQRIALLGAPALAVAAAGIWLAQSPAGIGLGRTLNAAVAAAGASVGEAWRSLTSSQNDTAPPARAVDASPPPPASALPAVATPPAVPAVGTPKAAPAIARSSAPSGAVADPHIAGVSKVALNDASATAVAGAHPVKEVVAEGAPHVVFAAQSYVVGAGDPAARIVIQRQGDNRGDLNFIWWTEGGTAEPDVDYASLGARSEHLASGQDRVTVYVPIISNPLRSKSTQFHVALIDSTSHRGNGQADSARATVTIEGGG